MDWLARVESRAKTLTLGIEMATAHRDERRTRRTKRASVLIAIATLLAGSQRASADAIVVTQAMKASTIAEIFVDESGIRLLLEIGESDVAELQSTPSGKVSGGQLFTRDNSEDTFGRSLLERWELTADQQPLAGEITRIDQAKRIVRDEVTGEPLPEQPQDSETTVRVEIEYPFDRQPAEVTVQPPLDAGGNVAVSVGFVCYHNGLPVNDFRYLPTKVALDLDWSDPWYSKFRHRNFRRQFDAPLSVFLYVEPYEVRQEIVVRPKDLQNWLDLGIGPDTQLIPVAEQQELKKRVTEFLAAQNPITVDGKPVSGKLDRINFIRRTLRTTGIVFPPEDLDANSATLGVIFVYPISQLPQDVALTWELFSPKINDIPAKATDEAGGLPTRLTESDSTLAWHNYLKNPTIPTLVQLDTPPTRPTFTVPVISVVCCSLLIVVASIRWRKQDSVMRKPAAFWGTLASLGILAIVAAPLARITFAQPWTEAPVVSSHQARTLITGLLHNVYRSFDHHNDEVIYDRLAQSIDGDLLSEVFLDTRRSMEVKNQGGLRVNVKTVEVVSLEPIEGENESQWAFRCRWRVTGSIGHWGHTHRRENEHVANLAIAERDGRWKLVAIDRFSEPEKQSTGATAALASDDRR